uniref:Ig-like domain-containing protein n=1 Tax=Oncorhynchus tshawytscha TaxID=74940 RepID=A0A8C8CZE7_ONCTS
MYYKTPKYILYFSDCKGEAVDQQSGHVTALEGGLVTLSCNYTTSSTSPDLFWYIQLTRNSPQYVPRRDHVIATEGEQVTLDCQFDAVNMNDIYLFWYKLEVNDFPEFMLGRFPFGSKNATEFKWRFNAHMNSVTKSVPLMIQRVQLSDSAVYYCALKPTVTTGYTVQPPYKNINKNLHFLPISDMSIYWEIVLLLTTSC